MNQEVPVQTDEPQLVATFFLGDAVFGVRADEVQEVVRPGDITPVHEAPDYVVGIRNLRGRVVTVVDLAMRLDLGKELLGPESRILIFDWQSEPIGLLVDRMGDTISAGAAQMEPSPANVNGVQARNLRGVFRGAERLVAILNLAAALEMQSG
jgi:purine-binding chemotaxis protein CheW